ncbi:MAG: TerB family tellurite resistance protein [Candidatus Heimdallarchaeota archaeon]|nr:TerB family tellurite resistance protein [Candidatus Heimdallarchaeota archaeon]
MTSDESTFELTVRELMTTAKNDGIITPEEKDIIDQVRIDADSYSLILKESLSDGLIDSNEAERLDDLKQMIIDRAELIAKVDGVLDNDEKMLIKKLSDILNNHYKHSK